MQVLGAERQMEQRYMSAQVPADEGAARRVGAALQSQILWEGLQHIEQQRLHAYRNVSRE